MEKSRKLIPLSCVDKFVLAIDSKDEPMVFHVIATLKGGVNPERLNQAFLSAIEFHPVMKTVISRGKIFRGKYFWPLREVKEDFDRNILAFQDLAKLKDEEYERRLSLWLNTPIDLEREFPFKVLLIRRKEFEFSLIFSFHHCATDGTGARCFILTAIGQYIKGSGDLSLPGHMEEPKKGDELLRSAVSQGSGWRGFRKRTSSLLGLFPILIAKLYPPTRVAYERSRQLGRVHIIHGTINASELKGVTYMSKSLGVSIKDLVTAISPDLVRSGLFDDVTAFTEKMRLGTINDLLLAACFRAVERWNRIHGRISKKISIMVPINIRPMDHLYETVSNQLSMISISTNTKDRDDPSELLSTVSSSAK